LTWRALFSDDEDELRVLDRDEDEIEVATHSKFFTASETQGEAVIIEEESNNKTLAADIGADGGGGGSRDDPFGGPVILREHTSQWESPRLLMANPELLWKQGEEERGRGGPAIQTEEVSTAVSAGASGDPSPSSSKAASTGRKGQRKKLCLQPYRLLASFCPCLPSNPPGLPMPLLGAKLNRSSRDQSKEKEGSKQPGDSGYNSLLVRPDSELSDLTPHYCSPFCIYWKQCSDFTVDAVNP